MKTKPCKYGLRYIAKDYGKCPYCERQKAVKLILCMIVNGKTKEINEVV